MKKWLIMGFISLLAPIVSIFVCISQHQDTTGILVNLIFFGLCIAAAYFMKGSNVSKRGRVYLRSAFGLGASYATVKADDELALPNDKKPKEFPFRFVIYALVMSVPSLITMIILPKIAW